MDPTPSSKDRCMMVKRGGGGGLRDGLGLANVLPRHNLRCPALLALFFRTICGWGKRLSGILNYSTKCHNSPQPLNGVRHWRKIESVRKPSRDSPKRRIQAIPPSTSCILCLQLQECWGIEWSCSKVWEIERAGPGASSDRSTPTAQNRKPAQKKIKLWGVLQCQIRNGGLRPFG